MRALHTRRGPLPGAYEDRRRHPRFHFWRRAVVTRGEQLYATFTLNVSKSGLRVLSPEQMFPCERVSLALETGETFPVIIRRCRRLGEGCYECGAEFPIGKPPTATHPG
jgi:hypothetical protein